MHRKIRTPTGVVLISVLFIMVLLVMFASAVTVTVVNQQRHTLHFYHNAAALRAAETGINYAMARLSNDPCWRGYSDASGGHSYILKNCLEIFEHKDPSSATGYVEGKITMGSETGFFDLYFVKPSSTAAMKVFNQETDAGPVPQNITLCINNCIVAGGSSYPVPARTIDGTPVAGKTVPGNSVFIVCRGKAGPVEKIIESNFIVTPDSMYDSVVVGKDDVNFNIYGTKDSDKFLLGYNREGDTRSSIIRSGGNISLTNPSGRTDFFEVSRKSGGECDGQPNLPPNLKNGDSINHKQGQLAHIPDLKLDDIKPGISNRQNTLKAGTYVFSTRFDKETVPPTPLVDYIPCDTMDGLENTLKQESGKPQDVTDQFSEKIKNGQMKWDPVRCKLTLTESCKITSSDAAGGQLNSVLFLSSAEEHLKIQVGGESEGNTASSTVYLVNDNPSGNIYVGGQLVGDGTVVCSNNLDLQAESQLETNEISGISLYAGGDITVNPIPVIAPDDTNSGQNDEPGGTTNSPAPNTPNNINNTPGQGKPATTNTRTTKETVLYGAGGTGKGMTIIKTENVNINIVVVTAGGGGTQPQAQPQTLSPLGLNNAIISGAFSKIQNALNSSGQNQVLIPIASFNADEILALQFYGFNLTTVGAAKYLGVTKGDTILRPDGSTRYYPMGDSQTHLSFNLFKEWDGHRILEPPSRSNYRERVLVYQDSVFRGLVYAGNNFTVNTPDHSFILEGGMVAAGKSVDTGARKSGVIEFNAADCSFLHNSKYLSILTKLGNNSMDVSYWAVTTTKKY